MSFEVRPGESLRKGIRRIVRKQLDDVLQELTGEHKGPRDGAVFCAVAWPRRDFATRSDTNSSDH